MRIITPVVYAVLFGTAIYAAIAQTSLPFGSAPAPAPADRASPAVLAYAGPDEGSARQAKSEVRPGRRETCKQTVAAKRLGRRETRDQLQLCVAQARVECLQQAIAQKVRPGTQRRVFVKGCLAG